MRDSSKLFCFSDQEIFIVGIVGIRAEVICRVPKSFFDGFDVFQLGHKVLCGIQFTVGWVKYTTEDYFVIYFQQVLKSPRVSMESLPFNNSGNGEQHVS